LLVLAKSGILPVLKGLDRGIHAAIFSFIAGVTPPMPILVIRSLTFDRPKARFPEI
jgi:hypothetical protein